MFLSSLLVFEERHAVLNSRFSFVIFADLILWSVHAGEDGAEQRLERPIAKERTENSEDNIGLP